MESRRRGTREFGAWVLSLFLAVGVLFGPAVQAASPPPQVVAPAAVLMDATTGQVLFAKHADQQRPMASVTKLMTLMLALRAVARGQVRLSDWVPVSMEAFKTKGSQIWLEPGEHLTLNQMLTAIAVGSANDASAAVAEFLSGSTGAFVERMNQAARSLHLQHTHFANPHGLPALEHYSTAEDLGRLAMAAVRTPKLLEYTSRFEDRSIRNGKGGTLWLINQNRLLKTYSGADGLKTGYTSEAGFCVVATAHRDGTRLIAVVLGDPTSKDRFADATTLLNWGFAHFRTAYPVAAGQILGPVMVRHGHRASVPVRPARTVAVTLQRGDQQALTTEINLPSAVTAPVHAGQVLGQLVVRQNGHVLTEVPLQAAAPVRAVGFAELVWRYFLRLVA
jgi:D-alanyl-D-alanine carboxypeptidase (penicillin-binding protein 5/6)